MDKVFLVLWGYQVDLVLRENIQLDETYYKVRQSDIETKEEGRQYQGLSRNQICIGIACDDTNVICFVEGKGKPTKQHIPGILLSYRTEVDNRATILVALLDLKSVEYDSRELKKISDRENPSNRINQYCRLPKQFLNAHFEFIRENFQGYLNLFAFIMN